MSLTVLEQNAPSVGVRSAANPRPQGLLALRYLLQRRDDLRALFVQFRAESRPVEWLRDMLLPRVAVELEECSFDEARDVCQYVADEYQQLACVPGCQLDDGWFVLDQETGRVVAVTRPEDVYIPGLLPREEGVQGEGLARLDPALEAAVIVGRHERAREAETLAWWEGQTQQTSLLRHEGDSRLRIATREGRTGIARELAGEAPSALLARLGGRAGAFLRHLSGGEELGTRNLLRIEGIACGRSVLGLPDKRALNLQYSPSSALRATAPQAWARDVARKLGYHVAGASRATVPLSAEDISDDLLASAELWVASPDVVRAAGRRRGQFFPVEGAETIGLSGCVGRLEVSSDIGVQTRELLDRWEVTSTISYTLDVDLRKIQFLPLVGIARASFVETTP